MGEDAPMVMRWRICGWLALLVAVVGAAGAMAGPPAATGPATAPTANAAMPGTPGFHNLDEFLLMHRRGEKPPVHRPTTEQLLAISYTPPNSADAELAKPLQKFLPWWFLNNCGRDNSPGLKEQMLGRKNVFVTTPLARDVPCRLMYTLAVAKQKKTRLKLMAAAAPEGQWELAVLAESKELLKRTIGAGAATAASPPANPWVELSVDLSGFAGQQVHLELQNRQGGSAHSEAYWADVRIVEE